MLHSVLRFIRQRWLLVGTLIALLALIGFAKVADEILEVSDLHNVNQRVLHTLYAHSTSTLAMVAMWLSTLGDVVGNLIVNGISLIALLMLRRYLDAAILILIVVGSGALTFLLKQLYRLPRPALFESISPASGLAF